MTKAKLMINVLILMSLLFVLSLAGCASETPAVEPEAPVEETETPEEEPEEEPEAVELSFEPNEYVNAEYSFSVQYPVEWGANPISEPSTIVLYAVSEDAVPLIFVNVAEAATFEDALNGAIAAAEGSKVEIDSQEATKLEDGTDATLAIFKFKHPAAPLALDAIAIGTQKDGKWITVTVATLGVIASFDEVLFSEIVHTLQVN